MIFLSADYLVPVASPPIKHGVLALHENGIIDGVYQPGEAPVPLSQIKQLHGILCPGFVNTHCHLELSYLKDKIAKNTGLDGFISQIEQQKKKGPDADKINAAIITAQDEMLNNCIVAAGDISNTDATFQEKKLGDLIYHTFIEVFGSDPQRADEFFSKARQLYAQAISQGLTASIVPHSPYSVSKELFRLIGSFAFKTGGLLSLHHQENEDENRYFESGDGPVAERLKRFGVAVPDFISPGRPLPSVANYLPWDNKILLVHNTVSDEGDIAYAMQNFNKLWWCLCPNANLFITGKLPDIPILRKAGSRIALGTDSLASNQQLSILEEMKTISKHYPEVGLEELLGWATINGADALGFSAQLGSFEAGKKPGIVLIEQEVGENVVLAQDSRANRIM